MAVRLTPTTQFMEEFIFMTNKALYNMIDLEPIKIFESPYEEASFSSICKLLVDTGGFTFWGKTVTTHCDHGCRRCQLIPL